MKRYSVKIIHDNYLAFSDIIKSHDAGHALSRISRIIGAYDNFKIECKLVEDEKSKGGIK